MYAGPVGYMQSENPYYYITYNKFTFEKIKDELKIFVLKKNLGEIYAYIEREAVEKRLSCNQALYFPKYNFFYIKPKQYVPFSNSLFLQFISLFKLIQKETKFYNDRSLVSCNQIFYNKSEILKNSTLSILKFSIIALYTKKSSIL
jgi:hypothetical protein